MTVDRNVVDPAKACVLGTPGTAPVALLWGDSHAMVTATAVEQAAKRKHASLLFAADADCPPGLGFSIDQRVNPALTNQLSYRYCATYNQRMLQRALGSHNIRTVILSSRWTNWRIGAPPNRAESFADVRLMDDAGRASSVKANEAKWQRGFLALVDRLTNAGKQVVIVGPLPEPTYNVPHRLYVQRFGLASYAEPITIAAYYERHAKILRFFEVMEHARGVTFVWPQQLLCRRSVCPVIEGDMPLYFDQDHLSVFGAEKTSPLYDHIFDKP